MVKKLIKTIKAKKINNDKQYLLSSKILLIIKFDYSNYK